MKVDFTFFMAYTAGMRGVKAALLAIITVFIFKLFFFDFMIAHGNSMEPAIKDGTVMIVNRLRYGFKLPWQKSYFVVWAQPKLGEVVVFYTPDGELAVKRCSELTEWGSFNVKGDNVSTSFDSRSYGPVPLNNIIGKVLGY